MSKRNDRRYDRRYANDRAYPNHPEYPKDNRCPKDCERKGVRGYPNHPEYPKDNICPNDPEHMRDSPDGRGTGNANGHGSGNTKEYHPIPTGYPNGTGTGNAATVHTGADPRISGWADMSATLGASKRGITEGYLNQRMPRNNDIGMNQAYVTKVLENPRTPRENRMAVIEYVRKYPEKFTPVADIHDDREYRDWARRHNGKGRRGFVKEFLDRYGGTT